MCFLIYWACRVGLLGLLPFFKRIANRAKTASPSWSLFRPLSSWQTGTADLLAIPAVGECIDILANDVARVPVETEARAANGYEVFEGVVGQILTSGPNDLLSGNAWRQKIVRDLLIDGAHVSVITRDGRGNVLEVTPCERGTWGFNWDPINQRLSYQAFGTMFQPSDVLHFRRAERQWFQGVGVLEQYKSTLEQIAASYGAAKRVFKSALPKLKLETDEPLSSDAVARLQEAFRSTHGDASTWSSPIVVSGGMKVGEVSSKLSEQDWAAAVGFGVADAARCFCVPVSLISSDSPTAEDMSAYIEQGLRPLLASIEAELQLKLMVPGERVCFRTAHLSRGTASAQAAAARQLIDAGIQTPNEARISLGMPPLDRPEMDEVQISKNYTPLAAPNSGADDVGSDASGGLPDA